MFDYCVEQGVKVFYVGKSYNDDLYIGVLGKCGIKRWPREFEWMNIRVSHCDGDYKAVLRSWLKTEYYLKTVDPNILHKALYDMAATG